MDDPPAVGRCESIANLTRVVQAFANRERSLFKLFAQGSPFEQLRDDVWASVLSADVMDRENIGMI